MRPIVIGLCLFAAACSGRSPESPTSATSAAPTRAAAEARGGAQLPFNGSYTEETAGALNCPPTCPPTVVRVTGEGTGEATHLGHFTLTSVEILDLTTATGTGTYTYTAANGDQLFATGAGKETKFTPPNISDVVITATIVGGTGRFAGATGAFTIQFEQLLDLANNRASSAGTFEGHINLNQ